MTLRLNIARKLAEQASDTFEDGRAYWLACADDVLAVVAADRCSSFAYSLGAQAIEAFGQDAKRLDGEATKARSACRCAQPRRA